MTGSATTLEAVGVGNGSHSRDRAYVLGCWIDRVDMEQAVAICEEAVLSRQQVQHVAINAFKLVALRADPGLRRVVEGCELVAADSHPILWASRLLGDPLPCHVGGIELMHELFALSERKGYSVYVLGAKPEVLDKAIARIGEMHPRLRIAGYHHGYFDNDDDRAVAEEIAAAAPDILFVAISSPRKEQFLGENRDILNVPVMMGVGGSIDIVAGVTQRAPTWMNRTGLEWLFRLIQEPRRLFRRYAVTNSLFLGILLRELMSRQFRKLLHSPNDAP
jgi:N-acetylglucosaminyldiphosphoundecaprenol N-acetyl-beta-D-mannosaminyltransferase